jgi:hypothetical protein
VAGVTDKASGSPSAPVPGALRVAIGLLAAQAVAVALLVAFLLYKDLTAEVVVVRDAVIVTGFTAIMAILLGLFAWALARRRGWARGPAVVLELMLLPIGWFMTTGGLAWLGVPVLLIGLLGAGLLVAPATRQALGVE